MFPKRFGWPITRASLLSIAARTHRSGIRSIDTQGRNQYVDCWPHTADQQPPLEIMIVNVKKRESHCRNWANISSPSVHPLERKSLSKKHVKQHYDITMWQTTARAGPSESLIAGVSPNWSFEPPLPVTLLCHTSLAEETKMIIWLLAACFAFTKRQVHLGSYWGQDRQKTSKMSAVYFYQLVQPESTGWFFLLVRPKNDFVQDP